MSQNSSKKPSLIPSIIRDFIATESAGGVVMIFFTMLALLAANSGFSEWYKVFISTPVTFGYGAGVVVAPLKQWVKDILMVPFFLVISLELKREMREGYLSNRSQIMLPLAAAAGGMLAPALIFLGMNYHQPINLAGWAIPSATDIAFALCILMLLGKAIPPALKVFLLAIAIFDDLGAIVIIAAFYNTQLAPMPLLLALIGIGVLVLLNRSNVTILTPYFLVGVCLWFFFYQSGIHTTIAGVAVGMAIPIRDKANPEHSPLNDCMHALHPWISFLVLPLFAFTSAGVSFEGMSLAKLLDPLPMGIALGLFFGKQIGIFGVTFLLVKLGIASRPEGTNWMHLYGVSILAGIGFTMSLFIGLLAFSDVAMQDMVKIGVIGGSLLSTLWGFIVLRLCSRKYVLQK